MTQNIIWGLVAVAGISLLAAFLWLRSKKTLKGEFDYSRLDEDERQYVDDHLEDHLEDQNPESFDQLVWQALKDEPFWLALLVILQLVTAAITAWFWFGAGAGIGAKIFAGMFSLFNFAVLPYLLGKFKTSAIAALMSLAIIAVSFLAASGLASMATKSQARDSATAEKDRLRAIDQIVQKQEALLGIDKSKTIGTLETEKANLQTSRDDVFLTQVRWVSRQRPTGRSRFGTLDDLSSHCKTPGPVKNAGRLCADVRGINTKISDVENKITALQSAARIRSEIAELEKRRDKKAAQSTSDPLAPIRSVLPDHIASALGNGWSLMLACVGELIINGFAYLRMGDANQTARRKMRLGRQKTFRNLVQEAKKSTNPAAPAAPAVDPMLNRKLEQQFAEKSAELDQAAADAETARAAAFAEKERQAQDALDALKATREQMERVVENTMGDVKSRLQPVITYINQRLERVPGVPVSLAVVINDYARWARHTGNPTIERVDLASLLDQAGLQSFSADNLTYLADHRLKTVAVVA